MERNISLDYFKILLATLVITIHIQPLFAKTSLLGWLVSNGIARIAVPCFFIINGYYLFLKITDNKAVFKYLSRLFVIYMTWALIYLPFSFGGSIPKTFLVLFVGFYHLWYVPALIIGAFLLFLLKKFIKNDKVLLILAVILYLTGSAIQYSFVSTSLAELLLYRNALFAAFPFIFIGYYIHLHKDKILNYSSYILFSLLLVTFATIFLESYYSFTILSEKDMFLSLIILCPVLVVMVLKYSKYTVNDGYVGLLASGIYFSHLLSIMLISRVFELEDFNNVYFIPLVLLLAGIITAGVIEINKRIKIFL